MKLYVQRKPTHYLPIEGGAWVPWDSEGCLDEEDLLVTDGENRQRYGIKFHALAFGNERWDVVNGWTPALKIDHSGERPRTVWAA